MKEILVKCNTKEDSPCYECGSIGFSLGINQSSNGIEFVLTMLI